MKATLGQLLIVGIQGPELLPNEAEFLRANDIGGVILFARNVVSPQQMHKLCTDIQNVHLGQPSRLPLFIGIDNEGGRVQRLVPPFTQWPAVKKLGDIDSTTAAFKMAYFMGTELKSVGVNLNFAPVTDVLTNPENKVIGDRSPSTDAEAVAKIASALIRGFIKADILPCAKHFPGHGNTFADSHDELPIEQTTLKTLESRELIPFKKAFRARLDLVMTAHIRFPDIDPEWPVTLSEKFLKDVLRDGQKYRNLVISDDLDMQALTKHHSVEMIPVLALKAGCDILLYCNNPATPPVGLTALQKALDSGEFPRARFEEAFQKVVALKKAKLTEFMPKPLEEVSRTVGHPDHLRLSKGISEGHVPEDLLAT